MQKIKIENNLLRIGFECLRILRISSLNNAKLLQKMTENAMKVDFILTRT